MSFPCTLLIPKLPEQEVKRHSIHGITEGIDKIKPHQEIGHLSLNEKHYLLAVERGDIVKVTRLLMQNNIEENQQKPEPSCLININCIDPLGRSAILIAIDNENYEMLKLLITYNVDTKDALLYAVSEEFVEAVELLLDCEEKKWKEGNPHSWECRPHDTSIFTSDITPLILAAHRDNYEIIKILLDKGACLPIPHDTRCNCEDCVTMSSEDSLLYSYSRINAYRALASPSLIVLTSKDPVLTAFELSWALGRLSKLEHEFKSDYQELRMKCQEFATDLLNHVRSSNELEILLNYSLTADPRQFDGTVRLDRLKLAIKLKQKGFVAHPNVQQLLASIWYAGLPGFRRKNTILQTLEVLKIGFLFPFYSMIYVIAPWSSFGKRMRTPFFKFLCHAAAYFLFLLLVMISTMLQQVQDWKTRNKIMYIILAYIIGLMWLEIKTLWRDGLTEYVHNMWNFVHFVTTALYVANISIQLFLRLTPKGRSTLNHDRSELDKFHPKLVSEALFSTANIFSTLRVVHIFSINPHLGPLQIVLARVILDIAKFFLVYVLVLLAFSIGLDHLLSPYSKAHMDFCTNTTISEKERETCKEVPYNKFINLFETAQVLFWTAFGEIHLDYFSLYNIQNTTKFWAMFMYGSFCVISLVVLLNLLIAMMDHSYNQIIDDADVEWKFARSRLWISFFEEGGTAPVPFNIIPSPKSVWYLLKWLYRLLCSKSHVEESRSKSIQMSLNEMRYRGVMKNLVQRYVIARQKKGSEHGGVTEDDINEVKQEIVSFKSELIQILNESGIKAKQLNDNSAVMQGKKNRSKERRIFRGLNMELPDAVSDSLEFVEAELEKSLLEDDKRNEAKYPFSVLQPILQSTPISIFKRTKLKNMFGKNVSKQSWESNDEMENELKTPDSVAEQNADFEKKVWFMESHSRNAVLPNQTGEQDLDLHYVDDSLEHHDTNEN